MSPALSIITPTWNRADYLERVWSGLATQMVHDFEWIVGDDGSNDGTDAVVRDLAQRSHFPVLYIRADAHVGKARMDNEAVSRARGELTLWCDSDDVLVPEAIDYILTAWRTIPINERRHFSGLTALAATSAGIIEDPFYQNISDNVSWNDLAALYNVKSDMLYVARTKALQRHPFPEVDLVIPESAVWNLIGHDPARVLRKVLLIKEYQGEKGISFSGRMAYNRGRAHSAAITRRALRRYRTNWRTRGWELLTFLRYAHHGEIPLREARALWGDNSSGLDFWAAVPIARLLALRDSLRGTVVRSHREFDRNRDAAVHATWLGAPA